MRYTCFIKADPVSQQCYQVITAYLNAYGWAIDEYNPSLIITIGGDGTVLAAIQKYLPILERVAFVGLHTGHLGFFNDYKLEEIKEFINDIVSKKAYIEVKSMLQAIIDNDFTNPFYALNEIRIMNSIKTQVLQISIDGKVLETIRGSGVCISTQAGSTAFNRSVGGAVLDDRLEVLQVSEINPLHNSVYGSLRSPLILGGSRRLRFYAEDYDGSILCYDHLFLSLQGKHQIDCCISEKKVNFARFRSTDFSDRLQVLF
jgi:NAD+ kinase